MVNIHGEVQELNEVFTEGDLHKDGKNRAKRKYKSKLLPGKIHD